MNNPSERTTIKVAHCARDQPQIVNHQRAPGELPLNEQEWAARIAEKRRKIAKVVDHPIEVEVVTAWHDWT
jgi:hypothetical protein